MGDFQGPTVNLPGGIFKCFSCKGNWFDKRCDSKWYQRTSRAFWRSRDLRPSWHISTPMTERHLVLKKYSCTTLVHSNALCFNKAKNKLNRINVQIDDTQEYHGIPYTDGSYLVCSKKITVTSENFMILTEHSLKSKATTMSPRLSALPASIINVKQQNSASSRIKREPLQVTGNPVEVAVVNTPLSICNNIPAVHSMNQERCIEIRHTKLFVVSFQPSYHQISSPRSH